VPQQFGAPDAQIDLTPLLATNEVNDAHTITATVQQDDGVPAGPPGDAVTGFGPAPDGTVVTLCDQRRNRDMFRSNQHQYTRIRRYPCHDNV
jgi:hypothetical protein